MARIRELAVNHDDDEIIRLLSAEGHQSSTGKPLTLSMIKWLRYKHRISAPRPPADTLNVRQVRDRYGVSLWVVHYWIARGVITAQQRKPNAPYEISIDEASDQLLWEWIANSVTSSPLIPNASCMRCIMRCFMPAMLPHLKSSRHHSFWEW